MKFADRHAVEGTFPVVYIGRRLYKRPNGQEKPSRRYYAEWCHDGQHQYEALGTTNKQAAIRRAHDIVRRLEEGQSKPRKWKLTIEELAEQYLQSKHDEGLAPKSLSKYENDLAQFRAWATKTETTSAITFSAGDFWKFSRSQREKKYHDKTVYSRLVLVKQAFKWAWQNKLVPEYTLLTAKLKEPEPSDQPCFTAEQVALLLEKAHPHEAPIYATLAYAGLRIGELRDLLWQDVLLETGSNGFLVIRRGGSSGSTKNKKVRRIPIHPLLRPYLLNLTRTGERVFHARPTKQRPEQDRPVSERRLLVSLKRLCRRVGFMQPERYKLHTFRHAFASMCARNNVSYKYTLEWMGHSSSDILDLYYSMYDEVAEQAIATIDYGPSALSASSGEGAAA